MSGLYVGLNTIDLQFLVASYPLENSKVKASNNAIATGGPATNAALVHSWLGGEAVLCSPIGEHAMKEFIWQDLTQYNIHVIDPVYGQKCDPVFASIITAQDTAHRTIYSYHPAFKSTRFHLPENLFSRHYQSVLTDGFYLPLLKQMLNNKLSYEKLILDGGSWKEGMEEILDYVDIAICSNHFYPPGCNDTNEVIRYLQSFKINQVIITRGDEPVLWHSGSQLTEIEIHKVNAVDTLGAGDFFHGAFCYFYNETNQIDLSVTKAAEIAALSCKHFGTREWLVEEISRINI
ncbi:MAG: sugar kinase [Bacteroidetes bacterium]|jgi:sugar/nucleoside kinase (ribokinase family)|nr:sugar kinase [Bacteroidota bacterium]